MKAETPAIPRAQASGAVVDRTIPGVVSAGAGTRSTVAVLEALAPPSGRPGLRVFGVHAPLGKIPAKQQVVQVSPNAWVRALM